MAANDVMLSSLRSPKEYHEDAADVSAQEFIKIVESRRSIRRYASDPIPETVVRECLRLAYLAPLSSNLHTAELYWVRNPEKKKLLAEYCLGQPAATTAQELVVCVARTDTWRRNAKWMVKALKERGLPTASTIKYYEKLIPIVYTTGPFSIFAPIKWIIFTAMGLMKPMVRDPLGNSGLQKWAIKSASLVCENLMLAYRAFGFDSCPMEGFDEKRVKKLLGLPRGAHVVMVISAGKRTKGGVYGPRIRLDQEHFIFEV
ncbi:MAG: nitroreductase family protein [Pseudobdellovibrionaceae bacterium]